MNYVEIVLLACGVLLLLTCIGSLFFGWLPELPSKVQKLKGLGIELEISVLSLIFLLSVGLCIPSVYWRTLDFDRKLAELKNLSEAAKKEAAEKIFDLTGQV